MDGPMIKGESFKEIVILERTKFKSVDDLARFASVAVGGKATGVYWANGIVFIYYPLPTSTEVAAKALIEEKKVYWAFVSYALMPQYISIIETKERIMVPVIDMSTSKLFSTVAEWLKEQL
jgi:ABC-type enterochelin transport system permease subunit